MAAYQYSSSILGVIYDAFVINPENMPVGNYTKNNASDNTIVSVRHLKSPVLKC